MTASRPIKRGTDLAQYGLLALGAGLIAASAFFGFSPVVSTIWCDWGYAPTRYVPVEDRPFGCTSFLSDEEANNGPDRNDTSWVGIVPEPSPTPLAVGATWDAVGPDSRRLVPPDPDRRGLVLLVAGLGFVGLSLGIGFWRGRVRDSASKPPVSAAD